MTPKEAITLVKECGLNIEGIKYAECEKVILNALEKQIPKKPIDGCYPWCICPACGGSVYLENMKEHILNNETTYCEHCGQAILWESEAEE